MRPPSLLDVDHQQLAEALHRDPRSDCCRHVAKLHWPWPCPLTKRPPGRLHQLPLESLSPAVLHRGKGCPATGRRAPPAVVEAEASSVQRPQTTTSTFST